MARSPDKPIPGYPQQRRQWDTPEIPPPPKVPTMPPAGASWLALAPKWAIGLLIVAPLFGGAAGIQALLNTLAAPKPATAEQGAALLERLKAVEDSNARIEKKLDAATERQGRRNQIVVEGLCKLNGGKPIARGAPCDELVWSPPPLDAQHPWSAREEWPVE